MDCASCHAPNDPGRRFCRRCGRRLDAACPGCGFANGRADDYCGSCGARLHGAVTEPQPDRLPVEEEAPVTAVPPGVIDEILSGAGEVGLVSEQEDAEGGPLSQEAIDKLFHRRKPGGTGSGP